VISTLHAGSCRGVFERLLALCRDSSAVASAVELVLNQRLLRRVCAACSGKGCPECLETRYRGRLPLVETLRLSDSLRPHVLNRGWEALAALPSLADKALEMVQAGLTDEEELRRVLGG
jgi:type II secretory ATPase GspE/PulE/Tfp pilus assembly ATPase PilB-like protein